MRDRLKFACWAAAIALGCLPVAGDDCIFGAGDDCGPPWCGDLDCTYVVVDPNAITEESDPILLLHGGRGLPDNYDPNDQEWDPNEDQTGVHLALNPSTGYPAFAWSQRFGATFEILYADYTPDQGWIEQRLTYNTDNDIDPHWWVDRYGNTHVTWWRNADDGKSTVYWATREVGQSVFESPMELATGGRRPTIVTSGSVVFVAFERPVVGGGQEIVVIKQGSFGTDVSVIGRTDREEPLHVRLRKIDDLISMVWRHTGRYVGYTEYRQGQWGASRYMFWPPEPDNSRGIGLR